MKKFRNNGAIGALLDEYERAIEDLKKVLENISPEQLMKVVDAETEDPDCKSIQTILTHVNRAGYWYVIEARNAQGEKKDLPEEKLFDTVEKYQTELDSMFSYTEKLFEDYPEIDLYKKVDIRWKQLTNLDLLFEHAIVHVLRHRRQIEMLFFDYYLTI